MTPTLRGRWQTRVFLFGVIGLPVTFVIALLTLPLTLGLGFIVLPLVLVFLLFVGLVLDLVYDRIQQGRWDHDWPVHLQIWAGLGELILVGFLLIPLWVLTAGVGLLIYPFHYAAVWIPSFLVLQGPLQILLPRWRFEGGEIWPRTPRKPPTSPP